MSTTAALPTPARPRDAVVKTRALDIPGARHEVLPPRMHTRGADALSRSSTRAAPP